MGFRKMPGRNAPSSLSAARMRMNARISRLEVVVLVLIATLVCTIGLSLAASPYSTLLIPSLGSIDLGGARPLHVEGRYVKDDLNRTVFLRGVNKPTFSGNTDGWWQPEGGTAYSGFGEWNPDAVAYNLDKMKELLGANLVRLHVNVAYWVDDRDNYRERLKTTISLANERGMYASISGYNNGAGGGPGGQSFLPWNPANPYIAGPADFVQWMAGETGSISSELSGYPNVLYEFWNEPVGSLQDRMDFYNACQDVIDALRARGDDHIVIYQFGYTGMESNGDIFKHETQGWGILQGTNIIYSVHTYRWIISHYTYFGYDDYTYERVEATMLPPYDPPNSTGIGIQTLVDNNLCWGNFEYGAAIGGQGHVPEEDQWREIEWYRNLHLFMNNYDACYTAWLWWDTSRNYPLLQDSTVYPWCPPLNEPGEILRDSIAAGL